jgi:hypothetical protein
VHQEDVRRVLGRGVLTVNKAARTGEQPAVIVRSSVAQHRAEPEAEWAEVFARLLRQSTEDTAHAGLVAAAPAMGQEITCLPRGERIGTGRLAKRWRLPNQPVFSMHPRRSLVEADLE